MSETAKTKRTFYNTGDNKGFRKVDFFEAVLSMTEDYEGETAESLVSKVAAACAHELEGIEIRAANKPETEKKNVLESDYAVSLADAVLPLIGKTPKSLSQLHEEVAAKGILSPTGKKFSLPWIGRVLNLITENGDLVKESIKVTVTNKQGLKEEKMVNAYRKP